MMEFLIFLGVGATAYFAWRIVDQLPDVLYRLSEIQRDIAELRRRSQGEDGSAGEAGNESDREVSPSS